MAIITNLLLRLVPSAAAVASLIAVTGCQTPQRQTLIQPACLFLCEANQSPIAQGDTVLEQLPPVAPVPKPRRK
jgi:hypothetical protein